MSTFKNYTPHEIKLNDGRTFLYEGLARVYATFLDIEDYVCNQQFGEIIGLPEPAEGVLYIVSALVLTASMTQGRTDCVAPATVYPICERDEKGYIKSVPCFVR